MFGYTCVELKIKFAWVSVVPFFFAVIFQFFLFLTTIFEVSDHKTGSNTTALVTYFSGTWYFEFCVKPTTFIFKIILRQYINNTTIIVINVLTFAFYKYFFTSYVVLYGYTSKIVFNWTKRAGHEVSSSLQLFVSTNFKLL